MYRRQGDIALVIYMVLRNQGNEMATAKVHREIIKAWNLPDDFVFDYAINNTAKLFEPYIFPMEHIMMGQTPVNYPDKNKFFLRQDYSHKTTLLGAYSIFVNNSPNAAAAIFYPEVPAKLAAILQDDFFVVTPFMSYVIIHAKKSLPLADIKDMARKAKHSPHENPEEFLTENVYWYSRKRDTLKML